MLKAELHTHINVDPLDKGWVKYSGRQLVDAALRKKYDVLAITCHNLVYQDDSLKQYAASKGLLLIYGVERDIEEKHTLLFNVTPQEAADVKTFANLAELRKKKNILVIAAHPLYPGPTCVGKRLVTYRDLYDAWEHSFFYTWFYNPNKRLLHLAKKFHKPVVGNSDVHVLKDLGRTYSLIDAEKNEEAVFQAIRDGRVKIVTQELDIGEFLFISIKAIFSTLRKMLL